MTTLLLVIHIIVCFFLISVVLLQSGKGAEMGAAFGGSSQTLFGSRGAATFLSKLTTISAVVFMVTSLLLAIVTSKSTSVVKQAPVAEEQTTLPGEEGPLKGTEALPFEALPLQPSQQTPQPAQQPTTE